ncbi:hypothetical protein [Cellulomonas edaphi]|uniref:Uncharacterized protein n=1 Tax=Cellulomonas edaphi TaxID=3053468 RepID=A0ABT7S739_9CELL|nr:hypothetical protein [Cellulomons edaphi]MDM7831435.1 hypothetical protein [Cellulomons edaphi]
MALRPQWEWLLEGGTDQPVSPVFSTQYDAEQWVGESWRALAARGVTRATLLHQGEPATAPIDLPQG